MFLDCFKKKKPSAKTPVNEEPEQPNTPEADPQFVAHLKEMLPCAMVGGLFVNGSGDFIEIKVNDKKFYAMISSATTFSFCHPALIQTLGLQEYKVDGLSIRGYGGSTKFSGYCKANLELGQIFIDDIELLVCADDMPFNLMIGLDVLEAIGKKYGYGFGFDMNHFKFGPYVFPKLHVKFSQSQ